MKLCNITEQKKDILVPQFAASGWIEKNNIGDINESLIGKSIPSGSRLRWSLPWSTKTIEYNFPDKIIIYRVIVDGALNFDNLCGMEPSIHLPRNFWEDLFRDNDSTTNIQIWKPSEPEGIVNAVSYQNLQNNDLQITLELKNGRKLAEGIVKQGQTFYFEGNGIARVIITGYLHNPFLNRPQGLFVSIDSLKEMQSQKIMEINCKALLDTKITNDEIKKRLSSTDGTSLLYINDNLLDEFRRDFALALNDNDENAWNRVQIACSESWMLSVFAGFGCIDGQNLDVPNCDSIYSPDLRLSKNNVDSNSPFIYFGEIIMTSKHDSKQHIITTLPAFAPSKAIALQTPDLDIIPESFQATIKNADHRKVEKDANGNDLGMIKDESKNATIYLGKGSIDAIFNSGKNYSVNIYAVPTITKSVIANREADNLEEISFKIFDSPINEPCVIWDGTYVKRKLTIDVRLPFIDSELGLNSILLKDGWDRLKKFGKDLKEQELSLTDYNSISQSIFNAKFIAFKEEVEIGLENNPLPNENEDRVPVNIWEPKEVDLLLNSSLVILQRRSIDEFHSFKIILGQIMPSIDTTEFLCHFIFDQVAPTYSTVQNLIGGILLVEDFQAIIVSIEKYATNDWILTLSSETVCANISLPPENIKGVIEENTNTSPRLWEEVGKVSLKELVKNSYELKNGFKIAFSNNKKESQLLFYTTKLEMQYSGKIYNGPIMTPSVPMQYFAQVPPKPVGQFSVQTLGEDFYNRTALRVTGTSFDFLNSELSHRFVFTNLSLNEDLQKLQEAEAELTENNKKIQDSIIEGEIGLQKAYEHSTLFELFSDSSFNSSGVIGITSKSADENASEILLQKIRRIT